MKLYNLIFLILISTCLILYNQPLFYDARKKSILLLYSENSKFINTTVDLIVDYKNSISVEYEIKYRKITMV